VLLSPIGYSPTGEIFISALEDVATQAAVELAADKLIFLNEHRRSAGQGPHHPQRPHRSTRRGKCWKRRRSCRGRDLLPAVRDQRCTQGVKRAHLISRHRDGALPVRNWFTPRRRRHPHHAGATGNPGPATIDDVGGILGLIEAAGARWHSGARSRELLEMEVERFLVLESEASSPAARHFIPSRRAGGPNSPAWQWHRLPGRGFGNLVAAEAEKRGKKPAFKKLFVLTTRTEHWFESALCRQQPRPSAQNRQAYTTTSGKIQGLQKSL